MIFSDTHTHTYFSYDGKQTPEALVASASQKGLRYLAVTEHYDLDLDIFGYTYHHLPDLDGQQAKLAELRTEVQDLRIACGVELGFCEGADYGELLKRYDFDVVLNSVHLVEGEDIYDQSYFEKRTREQAYGAYVSAILASVNAPYDYDIVGHFGYVARRSPYPNPVLTLAEFPEQIEQILRLIVQKGKCLEVNTHTGNTNADYFPHISILRRYRELGGELIAVGSDAHTSNRVAERFDLVARDLKSLGFSRIYNYEKRKPSLIFPL